jgi:riboflavin transporter FmnP
MSTKAFVISIAFAVIAMVLNPAVTGIKIPAPFLPGMYYQVWDIPIIVAFLLLGFKYGVFAGLLNSFFLFAVFPGPSQPLYAPSSVISELSMMIGIYLGIKLFIRLGIAQKTVSRIKIIVSSTLLGIIVRIPIMLTVTFFFLRYLMGFGQSVTFSFLLVQIFYIIITVAYTIPSAFAVARIINKNLKVGNLLA